ncbi:CRISPR-associated endonuclease Cas2 [Spirulina subsalsa FACHB-351]|uniref:CRISPR-associated endoribonuclease Cas2 n=1 Tax=Spirulina subsalsa FACHB-351 TaxID=234711 RepID=A0ABT3LBE0_9CYAN|nr:CRISPR-associated endonuclease Cas2 [Spirulina subsalsa]MCW6038823.1 CRISPR-associated endonuclease Cas2 [Spirulina subsalsa FACHB-351]
MFYVIAYDIPNDKRRKKVADLLEGYGVRVQYSVFECVLTPQQYGELSARLKRRMNMSEDNIRVYPVSSHTLTQVEIWGVGLPLTESGRSVII